MHVSVGGVSLQVQFQGYKLGYMLGDDFRAFFREEDLFGLFLCMRVKRVIVLDLDSINPVKPVPTVRN